MPRHAVPLQACRQMVHPEERTIGCHRDKGMFVPAAQQKIIRHQVEPGTGGEGLQPLSPHLAASPEHQQTPAIPEVPCNLRLSLVLQPIRGQGQLGQAGHRLIVQPGRPDVAQHVDSAPFLHLEHRLVAGRLHHGAGWNQLRGHLRLTGEPRMKGLMLSRKKCGIKCQQVVGPPELAGTRRDIRKDRLALDQSIGGARVLPDHHPIGLPRASIHRHPPSRHIRMGLSLSVRRRNLQGCRPDRGPAGTHSPGPDA